MTTRYEITEVAAWVREGFSSRSITCVEHEGFTREVQGYRVVRDGVKLFPAYPPFKTRAEAEAWIAEKVAA